MLLRFGSPNLRLAAVGADELEVQIADGGDESVGGQHEVKINRDRLVGDL